MNATSFVSGSYDYRLVTLSLVIAILTSYAALDLGARVWANHGFSRAIWPLGGAFARGSGIWCDTVTPEVRDEITADLKKIDVPFLLEEIPKAIDDSLEGVKRVSGLVSAMKDFSHPGTKEKVPLDLNHATQSTITVAQNERKHIAELIAEKVGQKSKIKMQTSRCPMGVEIKVGDTGAGIPLTVRAKIFDPFFTTKEIGKGTGQGLAIARSIIIGKHNGSIDFESVVGEGTTFILRLPLTGKESSKELVSA